MNWVPGLGTALIWYQLACPTNTPVWTVFFEDFIVRWTPGGGGGGVTYCKSNAVVRATVGVVSATHIMSHFALEKSTPPLSAQHRVLFPSYFGTLVLLSQGGGGDVLERPYTIGGGGSRPNPPFPLLIHCWRGGGG